jgi:hypothetical protein
MRALIKLLILIFFIGFVGLQRVSAHPHLPSLNLSLYITQPPVGYALNLNNIGAYNSSEGNIFTCLKPYTNGVLSTINGDSQFAIAFNIVSGSEGIIGLSDSHVFSPKNPLGSDGLILSCSGSYETTTGVYSDIILVGSSLLKVSFDLLDASLFTFKLSSSETLQKSQSPIPVKFEPEKNSRIMPVESNITITFNKLIYRGEGEIELVNSELETIEVFNVNDSTELKIDGYKLVLEPKGVLNSDQNYKVKIPVGAVIDENGSQYVGLDDYNFKTQIDIAFLLSGYNGKTLYETADSFKPNATKISSFLGSLSAGEIRSHRAHVLANLEISGELAQSLGDLETVNAAIENWGADELSNYFRDKIGNPDALQQPTLQQIEVLRDLRQWLLDNRQGAQGWANTPLGEQHYSDWVSTKVLRFSRPIYFLLDRLTLPSDFVPKEYKVISFILSSADRTNFSAAASNFNALGGAQWAIKNAEGIKLTHDQDFFYSDHSDSLGDTPSELFLYNNTRVDVHEALHTWGQAGHDQDPLRVGYSTMSQAGGDADLQFRRDPPTYPIYNRVYLMGWLPESVITTNANLIKDSADPVLLDQKYLLKVGPFKYQELYDGQWFQYSVPSLLLQLNACKTTSIVTKPTAINPNWDAGNLCKPILKDKNCGTKTEIFGLPEEMWDFRNCQFIDVDTEISRDIFKSYLNDFDGVYSGAINFDALTIEVTDPSLRDVAN